MLISVNWLRDYVDIPDEEPSVLASRITLSTCEVEAYTKVGQHLKSIVAAKIESFTQHPNADKLSLVKVSDGESVFDIVCGASNFKEGDIVPFAKIGTVLPDDFKIKKSKIRGVESFGMLCAEDELGLSDDHVGLMILSQDVAVGTPLSELFPDAIDLIIEIDNKSVTHRPDLWGHYGFAREISVIFNTSLKPMVDPSSCDIPSGDPMIKVEVSPETKARRFTALGINKLKITPSSDLIRFRLHRVGSRAINNLVDVTNYLMLDYGQPMHAFDGGNIPGGQLIVKNGEMGEKLMTLQNKEAALTPEDVTIYDGSGPTAIAGVIGGTKSGIQDDTTSLFLEAGCWDPVLTRRTSTRLGIRTEASQRYEKSLDPCLCLPSIIKSMQVLQETCPEMEISGGLFDFLPSQPNTPVILLRQKKINDLLGVNVSPEQVSDILIQLGFEVNNAGEDFQVTVPSWRATKDISIEEDLIEEIGRIYGVNNIPSIAPKFPIEKPQYNEMRKFERQIKESLASNGLHEVYTYPINSEEMEKEMGYEQITAMSLVNPITEQLHQMRTAILPLYIPIIHENQKIDHNFSFFEVGKIYGTASSGKSFEQHRLVLTFVSDGKIEEQFTKVKKTITRLFSKLKLAAEWKQAEGDEIKLFAHPYRSAMIDVGDKKNVGTVFSLNSQFMKEKELEGSVFFAEFDFDAMFQIYNESKVKKITGISRYPSVIFDISILARTRDNFSFFKNLILNCDRRVESVKFMYDYIIPNEDNQKSLTISITFRDQNKTILAEEADQLRAKVIKALAKNNYSLR